MNSEHNLNRAEAAKIRSKNPLNAHLSDDNNCVMNLPGVESDTSDDAKQTYKAFNQNIDTDLSLSHDEDKGSVSPPLRPPLRCPDPVRSVTSSDSDSFTDSDVLAPRAQVSDGSSSSTSESEETQM